jgi:hypothetical protein
MTTRAIERFARGRPVAARLTIAYAIGCMLGAVAALAILVELLDAISL